MSGAHSLVHADRPRRRENPSDVEDRGLRVELEVVRGGSCVMEQVDGEVIDVDIRFDGGDCQCDIGVRQRTAEGERTFTKHFTRSVCEYCPGIVFADYGCIPRYLRIDDGSFVMETYTSDTETVAEIVNDVRERCESVSVRSITSTEGLEYPETCTVDLSVLTPKQREAVHRAKLAGYYDPGTKVPLEELAEELGISKSALSQRLQRAEGNVLRQLSCECSCRDRRA